DDKSYTVLLDVGGDDAGAAALGQFSAIIKSAGDYRHFYVFNARRPLTQTPQQAVDILREIERASRIPADALVNNTNLAIETDADVIGDSAAYARAVSSISGLPLAFTCVREGLEPPCCGEILPVQIFVNAPWNESPQNIE
ncbi:MAG: ParA family protein, partial [Clostridia bacterium]|nr:ParA family protein [Clostridia bacterium]